MNEGEYDYRKTNYLQRSYSTLGGREQAGSFHREGSNSELPMASYRKNGQRFIGFDQLREALALDEHDREDCG